MEKYTEMYEDPVHAYTDKDLVRALEINLLRKEILENDIIRVLDRMKDAVNKRHPARFSFDIIYLDKYSGSLDKELKINRKLNSEFKRRSNKRCDMKML